MRSSAANRRRRKSRSSSNRARASSACSCDCPRPAFAARHDTARVPRRHVRSGALWPSAARGGGARRRSRCRRSGSFRPATRRIGRRLSHRRAIASRCSSSPCRNSPGSTIDAREMTRGGKSYTVRHADGACDARSPRRRSRCSSAPTRFADCPAWHRWRELFELAHLVVVPRPAIALDDLPEAAGAGMARTPRRRSAGLALADGGRDLSAAGHARSPFRRRRSAPRSPAAAPSTARIAGLLPAAVLAYIERKRLYSLLTECILTSCSKSPSPPSKTSRPATSGPRCPQAHQPVRHADHRRPPTRTGR